MGTTFYKRERMPSFVPRLLLDHIRWANQLRTVERVLLVSIAVPRLPSQLYAHEDFIAQQTLLHLQPVPWVLSELVKVLLNNQTARIVSVEDIALCSVLPTSLASAIKHSTVLRNQRLLYLNCLQLALSSTSQRVDIPSETLVKKVVTVLQDLSSRNLARLENITVRPVNIFLLLVKIAPQVNTVLALHCLHALMF